MIYKQTKLKRSIVKNFIKKTLYKIDKVGINSDILYSLYYIEDNQKVCICDFNTPSNKTWYKKICFWYNNMTEQDKIDNQKIHSEYYEKEIPLDTTPTNKFIDIIEEFLVRKNVNVYTYNLTLRELLQILNKIENAL